jgi:iron complex transport system substrate-binding protein
MPRFGRALLLTLALLASFPALAERLVTDMTGRQVRLPDQIHKVYAIGHCIPVVASLAPEKLANTFPLSERARRFVPPVFYEGKAMPAKGMFFSDEEVARMAPDLVVMEAMPGAAERVEALAEKWKIPIVLVHQDLPRLKASFHFLGDALGVPEQARAMEDFVATHLEPLAAKAKNIPAARRVKVYYAEGADGLSTSPAGSNHTQALEYIGGLNVANIEQKAGDPLIAVTPEQLQGWQPEWILVWTPGADRLTTWKALTGNPALQNLNAVRQGKVAQIPWIPFSWFDRPPGSNRVLGVFWLAQLLYPDVYQLDLPTLVKTYFRVFYHRELTPDEIRELLTLQAAEGGGA